MSHHTWAHRLVTIAVRPLARTSVTPNQITTLRLVSGLLAAAAFATGNGFLVDIGGGLWVLSMLCDRADGVLARMTGQSSPAGHVYDLICDFVVTTVLFVAVGVGIEGGLIGGLSVWLGLLAGASVGLMFWLLYRIERLMPDDKAASPTRAGFDPDDTLFIVAPLAWLGWMPEFLLVSAIGAPIAAAIVIGAYFRARRRVDVSDRKPLSESNS